MKNFICLSVLGTILLVTGIILAICGGVTMDDIDDNDNSSSVAVLVIGLICSIVGLILVSAASAARRRYYERCRHEHACAQPIVHVQYAYPSQHGQVYPGQNVAGFPAPPYGAYPNQATSGSYPPNAYNQYSFPGGAVPSTPISPVFPQEPPPAYQ